jgi:hypothetical protein
MLVLASPGDAWAQRSSLYYPPGYGRTYGYYVAPSPVYVQPWGYTEYGPRVVPSYSVPVDVLPTYRGTYITRPYHVGPSPYYVHW